MNNKFKNEDGITVTSMEKLSERDKKILYPLTHDDNFSPLQRVIIARESLGTIIDKVEITIKVLVRLEPIL